MFLQIAHFPYDHNLSSLDAVFILVEFHLEVLTCVNVSLKKDKFLERFAKTERACV